MAGAREFLVWAAPNVGMTPAIRSLGQARKNLAGSVTQAFNGGLAGVLSQLSAGLPGVSFARLDAYEILNAIVLIPSAFGLTT